MFIKCSIKLILLSLLFISGCSSSKDNVINAFKEQYIISSSEYVRYKDAKFVVNDLGDNSYRLDIYLDFYNYSSGKVCTCTSLLYQNGEFIIVRR